MVVKVTKTVRTVKIKRTVKSKRTVKTVKTTTIRPDVRTAKGKRGLLSFQPGNAKVGAWILSLPAGHTCPFALTCLSRADRETGKIKDGKAIEVRCHEASAEARLPSVRDSRWDNLALLREAKTAQGMADLILRSMPQRALLVRPHASGDYFSQNYFDAWLIVARARPEVEFYGYTKALAFWTNRLNVMPTNFTLTASRGGKQDHLIAQHGLREAIIVHRVEDAAALGLELDKDESHAMSKDGGSFALLIHGAQPKGSAAARAIAALRAQGEYGYGKRADEIREARRVALQMA